MNNDKILIVDDEASIRRLIRRSLANENYNIIEADSGKLALDILENEIFGLIILDVNLGDYDGFELIKDIKYRGITTPIIFVSGRNEDYDKILGLGLGANNYITKPFSPAILCAHVKSQLRIIKEFSKVHTNTSNHINQGQFKFDLNSYKFYKNQQFIDLSYKENAIIRFFMENPNRVFTKEQIYENIWCDAIVASHFFCKKLHGKLQKLWIELILLLIQSTVLFY